MWEIETDLPIQLSAIHLDHVQVTATETAYLKLERCARSYQTRYADRAIGKIQGVQTARSLFRAIGIDPTKRRPSSEALLRRALKGKALYTVNSLVDVGNWCSLDFLLPVCIYDVDRLNGDVVIRKGRENETYIGLNNHTINLHDRYMLADETGGFGSPITDSRRTAVSFDTRRAVLGIFAPADYPSETLAEQADCFAQRAMDVCGGVIAHREILGRPCGPAAAGPVGSEGAECQGHRPRSRNRQF